MFKQVCRITKSGRVPAMAVLLWAATVTGGCASGGVRHSAVASAKPDRGAKPAPLDISARLEPIRARAGVPALAAAVIRGERIVALGAAGVRKQGEPEPATTNDRFHLGSDTKAMTATMLAMLIEHGRLRWDTTLAEAFPELSETMHADYRDVTLEQLLRHRAGLPADLSRDGLWMRLLSRPGTPREQRKLLVDTVLSWPPAVPPGTQFLYSNAGYAVAGVMAERVTGEAWEDLMQRMLFEPLGMKSAMFGAPGTAGVLDEPRGHRAAGSLVTPVEPGPWVDNPPAIGPAGTVCCTLTDWAKFVSLHLHGEQRETGFLKSESFVRLHTPPAGGEYAAGWGVIQHPQEGRVLLHAGSNSMWFVQAWLAVDKDYAILVATNVGGAPGEQAAGEVIDDLIRWVGEQSEGSAAR